MKKVLALGVGGVMLLGVTVVGAAVLDEQDVTAACLPGGAAVTVNVDGLPEEIAATVAYFASDDSAYTTGQIVAVSGGFGLPTPIYGDMIERSERR